MYSKLFCRLAVTSSDAVLVGTFDKHSMYVLSYFNPPMCFTKSQNLWYYSTVLVIQLLIAVEICLLGVTFRVLHKVLLIFKITL